MVIKTRKLETDDRLRKECNSITDMDYDVDILCWLTRNSKKKSNCYKKSKFTTLRLITRILDKRFLLPLHFFEFFVKFVFVVCKKKPKVLWLHDPIMIGVIPAALLLQKLKLVERIVWDQHETPPAIIRKYKALRILFGWFCNLTDIVIVANDERAKYLKQSYLIKTRVINLNNYSDSEFINVPPKLLSEQLTDWLANREYFLAQNGADFKRNFESLARAIIENDLPPVVLVGYVDSKIKSNLKSEYGSLYENKFFEVGVVPQMELVAYLTNSIASIILYKNTDENQWYCEPNRLYQAINFKKPVLVGNNPTMANIVTKHSIGVVLEDDGSCIKNLTLGLKKLLNTRAIIESNYTSVGESYIWEKQESKIHNILSAS